MLDGSLTKTVLKKNVVKKAEWDFNVPDSKSDILKILSQTLSGTVLEYDVKENSLNAKIRVQANILYISDNDDEAGIAALESVETIVVKTEVPTGIEWDFANLSLDVSGLTPMLINSRKVGVRANANLDAALVKNVTLPQIDCLDNQIETRTKEIETYLSVISTDDKIPLSLNMLLPSGNPSILEILKTDIAIKNKDLKPISNKAVLKGDIEVSVLYISVDNTIETAEFLSPYTEIVDVSGLSDDLDMIFEARAVKNEVTVQENESNELRSIGINGSVDLKITANKRVNQTVVVDAYSPIYQDTSKRDILEYEEMSNLMADSVMIKEVVYFEGVNISEVVHIISEARVKKAEIAGNRVDISGALQSEARVKKAEIAGNRVDISGALQSNVFMRTDNGINSALKEIEFSCSQDGFKQKGYDTVAVSSELANVSYNIVGSNAIEIRATLILYTRLTKTSKLDYIREIKLNENQRHICNRAPIVAYFMKDEDTLFGVAKKFCTTTSKIREINGIEEEKLRVGQYIIIE